MTLAAAGKGAADAAPALDTTAGFFVIACLAIALALVVMQGVISYKTATSGKVDPDQLRDAAKQVREAGESLAKAAAKNEEVTQALQDAVRPARGARQQGLRTVDLFHQGTPGLAAQDQPVVDLLGQELRAFDPDRMVDPEQMAKAEEATESARAARKKAEDAADEVEKGAPKTSFFGLVGQITKQYPFIGAALLFVLVGALGADLINFTVS